MVKKKKDSEWVNTNPGFGKALMFMALTFVSLIVGCLTSDIIYYYIAILTGVLGLYWVKKSWKPWITPKDKSKKKK